MYTANSGDNTISKITPAGQVTEDWAILASDAAPGAMVLDASGNIYTANNGNSTVSKVEPVIHPAVNGILYVDSMAAPGGDGSSWATAVTDLSEALHYARIYAAGWASNGLGIYVAKGTYLPKYRADDNSLAVDDRNDAFVMVKNAQIFGGFPHGGGERNLAANPTILSGDLGTAGDISDNAYHVVISAGDVGSGSINDFIITGGNATGSGTITVKGQTVLGIAGGGVYTLSSDLLLTSLIISGNSAGSGGGMYSQHTLA